MNVSAGIFIDELINHPNADIISRIYSYDLYTNTIHINNISREVLYTSRYYFNQPIVDSNRHVVHSLTEVANIYRDTINNLSTDLLEYIPNKFYVFEEIETIQHFKLKLEILFEEYLEIDNMFRNPIMHKLKSWQH